MGRSSSRSALDALELLRHIPAVSTSSGLILLGLPLGNVVFAIISSDNFNTSLTRTWLGLFTGCALVWVHALASLASYPGTSGPLRIMVASRLGEITGLRLLNGQLGTLMDGTGLPTQVLRGLLSTTLPQTFQQFK